MHCLVLSQQKLDYWQIWWNLNLVRSNLYYYGNNLFIFILFIHINCHLNYCSLLQTKISWLELSQQKLDYWQIWSNLNLVRTRSNLYYYGNNLFILILFIHRNCHLNYYSLLQTKISWLELSQQNLDYWQIWSNLNFVSSNLHYYGSKPLLLIFYIHLYLFLNYYSLPQTQISFLVLFQQKLDYWHIWSNLNFVRSNLYYYGNNLFILILFIHRNCHLNYYSLLQTKISC